MRKVVNLNQTPSASQIVTQFFISIAIIFGFMLLFSIAGVYLAAFVTGQGILSFSTTDPASLSNTTVNGLKIIQIFSVIGLFVVPALLLPKILYKINPLKYTALSGRAHIVVFLLALLAYYALLPLLDLSISLNQSLNLPDSLQGLENWMRHSEEINGQITLRFLYMPTFTHFLLNVFLIALLPAFAEELFFRGFVQRTLYSWWRKKHLAVIISAAFFSFIHFQFFGFLPRMLLGMLLGYLLVWTGDLKVPIFVHFLNNFTSLVFAYMHRNEMDEFDINAPTTDYPVYIYFLSALVASFLLYQLYKYARKRYTVFGEEENIPLETGEIKWAKAFSTHSIYEAEIVAGKLQSEGIQAVVINKQDSSYGFGEAEIHVHADELELARQLISTFSL